VVTVMTLKVAQEIYQLRLMIESLGARLITLNPNYQMTSELEQSIELYESRIFARYFNSRPIFLISINWLNLPASSWSALA
jgi:DNA-binding GntR family transcriptional regulator